LLVILCFLGYRYLPYQEWSTNILSYISYPFITGQKALGDWRAERHERREGFDALSERYKSLVRERDALLQRLVVCEGAREYQYACKELIAFRQRYQLTTAVMVQVLQRHIARDGQFFFVDAGAKRGIVRDMVAIVNNHLVGRVTDVYPWYSKVILCTDTSSHIGAVCAQGGTRGIVEGMNDPQLKLNYVSHLDTIVDGDLVLSSGAGAVYPRGFLIGKIISHAVLGVHQEVFVRPAIDFEKIDHCLLIRKGDVHEGLDERVLQDAIAPQSVANEQGVAPAGPGALGEQTPAPVASVQPEPVQAAPEQAASQPAPPVPVEVAMPQKSEQAMPQVPESSVQHAPVKPASEHGVPEIPGTLVVQ